MGWGSRRKIKKKKDWNWKPQMSQIAQMKNGREAEAPLLSLLVSICVICVICGLKSGFFLGSC
jgi:hypothetical protein